MNYHEELVKLIHQYDEILGPIEEDDNLSVEIQMEAYRLRQKLVRLKRLFRTEPKLAVGDKRVWKSGGLGQIPMVITNVGNGDLIYKYEGCFDTYRASSMDLYLKATVAFVEPEPAIQVGKTYKWNYMADGGAFKVLEIKDGKVTYKYLNRNYPHPHTDSIEYVTGNAVEVKS